MHALPFPTLPSYAIATRSLGVNREKGWSTGVNREKRRSLGSLDTRSFCPRNRDERVSRLCQPHSPHPLLPSVAEGGVSRHPLPINPYPRATTPNRSIGVNWADGGSLRITRAEIHTVGTTLKTQ